MTACPCLVVAASGRLLAEAAVAAGHVVDVLDGFADRDCAAVARRCTALPWRAPGDPAPAEAPLLEAVSQWARQHTHGVLVAGTGFESRPQLLAELARRLPLAGSPAPACAAAKDPWRLAQACGRLGLRSPELCEPGTQDPAGWLSREVGGSGGGHLRPAQVDHNPVPQQPADAGGGAGTRADAGEDAGAARQGSPARVWQRHVPGVPVSLLFHAATDVCTGLSCQHQYLAPTPTQPWRFGAVVACNPASQPWSEALLRAAALLAPAFGLRGLNGIDALWDGTSLWVLELNPRPPASIALLSRAAVAHWMRAHVQSTWSHWPGTDAAAQAERLSPEGAGALAWDCDAHALNAGAAVVYASCRLSIPADFRFPPGCHDLPRVPHTCGPGDPVCSVQVSTGGIEKLRALIGILRERLLPLAGTDVLSVLHDQGSGEADPGRGLSAR